MVKKIDPIRNKYFKPLEKMERLQSLLFYGSGFFSITLLIINKSQYPNLFLLFQVLFTLIVISLAVVLIVIRLYLSPRAQEHRYKDFLSHAYSTVHYEQTKGYYNNNEVTPLRRMAAQTLESSLYTTRIIEKMLTQIRIKIIIYFIIWLIFVLNRNSDLTIISIITQIVFGELLIGRWMMMEWLRRKSENIFDNLFKIFNQNDTAFDVCSLEAIGIYEMSKANAGIALSEKAFNKVCDEIDAEWDEIRKKLKI